MKKVYLIGSAHLDPVWLWKKNEGLSEILSTYRSALDRMKEFPDYIFTSACASYYKWVEEIDPTMFQEIQARIRKGRWSITGGFWVQPDCNLPSGEAFARHSLYSQRYFYMKFQQIATSGYNVDSFGHNAMLPQLLKKSGMDHYIFMRPDLHENPDLPDLFIWESPDGSRVIAHKINYGYADYWGCPAELDPHADKVRLLTEKANETQLPYMNFYGVGNHGGGPTIRGLKVLEKVVADNKEAVFASTQDFFAAVDSSELPQTLPVVKGGLQHHASGCYAAFSAVKKANRLAENALVKAEKYDTLAHLLLGSPLSTKRLQTAWEKVLFNQFHDILAGCSIRDAYEEALNAFASATDIATEITAEALHRISWNVCTTQGLNQVPSQKNTWILWEKEGEGTPIVVFNPHSFAVQEIIQINTTVASVVDIHGKAMPCQDVRGPQTNGDDHSNTIFLAEIPAYGYAVYYVYRLQKFDPPAYPGVSAQSYTLENQYLRVVFDPDTGCIVSLYDKAEKRELAAGPMAKAVVIDDHTADTWAHGKFVFDQEIGTFADASVEILENGPVRATIRVTTHYQNSTLQQDFRLSTVAKEVEVCCKLDFHEQLKLVKLCFPANATEPAATYAVPYGFETKQPNGVEEPAQKWVRIRSSDGQGLALCNDCKYSFSAIPCDKGAEMRMTIARGAFFADHFGKRDSLMEPQDQGEQFFRYTLVPGSKIEDVVQRAAVLNTPPELLLETHHTGRLSPEHQEIQISESNVMLTAAKGAEDGNGYILRLVETAGKETAAEIHMDSLAAHFAVNMKPQEIKTLRIDRISNAVTEVLITEME